MKLKLKWKEDNDSVYHEDEDLHQSVMVVDSNIEDELLKALASAQEYYARKKKDRRVREKSYIIHSDSLDNLSPASIFNVNVVYLDQLLVSTSY